MPLRKGREISRSLILEQVVAGILWMSLDLPADVSRGELEALAHRLIALIRADAPESEIGAEFLLLYVDKFSRSANSSLIRSLIRRAESIVRAG